MKQPEREHIEAWREGELDYADAKFGDLRELQDEGMESGQLNDDGWWFPRIEQYIGRARVFGLETPQGRQALAKAWVGLGDCLESAIRVFGPLPEPGHSSGEIREWRTDETAPTLDP